MSKCWNIIRILHIVHRAIPKSIAKRSVHLLVAWPLVWLWGPVTDFLHSSWVGWNTKCFPGSNVSFSCWLANVSREHYNYLLFIFSKGSPLVNGHMQTLVGITAARSLPWNQWLIPDHPSQNMHFILKTRLVRLAWTTKDIPVVTCQVPRGQKSDGAERKLFDWRANVLLKTLEKRVRHLSRGLQETFDAMIDGRTEVCDKELQVRKVSRDTRQVWAWTTSSRSHPSALGSWIIGRAQSVATPRVMSHRTWPQRRRRRSCLHKSLPDDPTRCSDHSSRFDGWQPWFGINARARGGVKSQGAGQTHKT